MRSPGLLPTRQTNRWCVRKRPSDKADSPPVGEFAFLARVEATRQTSFASGVPRLGQRMTCGT